VPRSLAIVAALLEIAAIAWLIVRARRVGFARALPRPLVALVSLEIAALTFAFTGWFRRAPAGFSMHRRSSFVLILGTLIALAIVETAAMHLVIALASPLAAWIVTGVSAYGILWLLGSLHAARLSPARIDDGVLAIQKGLFWRVEVPLAAIASAEIVDGKVAGARDLSLAGPNVLLVLEPAVSVHGPFGIDRTATRLTLSLDDPGGFLAAVAPR
jgi:hypothetical protein